MTRKSKREIERLLEELAADNPDEDDSTEIVITDTIIATGHECSHSDAEPGTVVEESQKSYTF